MSKLRDLAQAAARVNHPEGGRMNRNDAMGAEFVSDVEGTITDQMALPMAKRLSVRHLFQLVTEAYPDYPNKYSSFRLWVRDRWGYVGASTTELKTGDKGG